MKDLVLTRCKPIFILFTLFSFAAHAQKINSPGIKDSSYHFQRMGSIADTSGAIEERLVQLALKQPLYQETEYQGKITESQLKIAKNSWLNLLTLSANYNDQTFASKKANSSQQPQYVYPKYFFGFNIPLGLIFNGGNTVKIAAENEKLISAQQAELAKTIRADVLSKYKEYQSYNALLALQNQTIDDQQAEFLQTEQKFRDGSVTIDVYNAASKAYSDELAARINMQLQQDLVKLDLERMIGMKLEDAMKLPTN